MNKKDAYVTKSNTIQDELAELHDTYGLTWRKIAQIPKFKDIPIQTLSMIYHGKREVPKRYRKRLGIPDLAPVPVCTNLDCSGYGEPHTYDCRTQTVRGRRSRRSGKPRSWPAHRAGWLLEIPEDELREMIESRREI